MKTIKTRSQQKNFFQFKIDVVLKMGAVSSCAIASCNRKLEEEKLLDDLWSRETHC